MKKVKRMIEVELHVETFPTCEFEHQYDLNPRYVRVRDSNLFICGICKKSKCNMCSSFADVHEAAEELSRHDIYENDFTWPAFNYCDQFAESVNHIFEKTAKIDSSKDNVCEECKEQIVGLIYDRLGSINDLQKRIAKEMKAAEKEFFKELNTAFKEEIKTIRSKK